MLFSFSDFVVWLHVTVEIVLYIYIEKNKNFLEK